MEAPSVQEHLTKLPHEQQKVITELSLGGPVTTIHSCIAGQHDLDTLITCSSDAGPLHSGSFHLPMVSTTPDEQEAAEALTYMSCSRVTFVTPQPFVKLTRNDPIGTDTSNSAIGTDDSAIRHRARRSRRRPRRRRSRACHCQLLHHIPKHARRS